jgi:plasmid replication initiation protein
MASKDITKDKGLRPDPYPQADFFICDVADAVLKDIMPQMEHPFYSLSKKPDISIRRYEYGKNWLEIVPSVKGMVTIYDKDFLLYAISQVITKLNMGLPISKRIVINTYEALVFTKRGTSGRDYKAFGDALERIRGTTFRTNIVTGDEEQTDIFGLIETASIKRKNGLDGRLLSCEIVLSDWVFNAIKAKEVLTLSPKYFQLRKPIERRIYEIARKHCGSQPSWIISIEKLYMKTGSRQPLRNFKITLKETCEINDLPDYEIALQGNNVCFTNKGTVKKRKTIGDDTQFYSLPTHIYEKARKVAPRYDP